MLDNKTSYIKLVLLSFILLLTIVILFYMFDERESIQKTISYIDENEEIIKFNFDSGYYNKTINVKLNLNKKISKHAQIFYTLDGNTPSKDSLLYKKPIKLKLKDNDIKVYNISAIIYYKGDYSKVINKTYVINNSIDNNLPIINIIINNYDLNDEVDGLFSEKHLSLRDAKYSKKADLIMFDTNGKKIINQNVGLLVSGAFSRYLPIKSLRLLALTNEKGEKEKISYEFNSGSSIVSQITKYHSLKLSANGQEQEYSYIRNSSINKLAYESNFDGYKDSDKCLVYINGEIYGVMNIEDSYSDSFIKNRYKLKEKNIEKYKMGDIKLFEKLEIYDKLENLDESTIKELEDLFDIDDLLLYYAIQLVSNNSDWPQNNYEVWRYNGEYDKNNKYSDGRFRFLLYDLDLVYFTKEYSLWKDWGVGVNKLGDLSSDSSSIFYRLMQNENYKNKFITIVNNLLNTSFNEDNVVNVFTEEYSKINNQVKLYMTDEEYENFQKYFNQTIEVIKNRDEELGKDLKKYLDAKKDYTINFKTDSGSMITIENINIYNDSEITYKYNSNNVTIKASSYPGYTFKYFVVNGERIKQNIINISNDCVVEAISEKNNDNLIISEIKSNSNDYIILTNVSNKTIDLNEYYLSDKKNNLLKYNLPKKNLKANQSIKIYGKNNLDSSFGDYVTSFNLKSAETVYVYNYKKKKLEDKIYVPDLNKKEIYFRDNNSNIFKIKLQK